MARHGVELDQAVQCVAPQLAWALYTKTPKLSKPTSVLSFLQHTTRGSALSASWSCRQSWCTRRVLAVERSFSFSTHSSALQYDKHSAHRSKVRIDEATRVLSVSYSTSFLKAFSLSTLIAMLSVINTNNITPGSCAPALTVHF